MQDEFFMRLWTSNHERVSHDPVRRGKAPDANPVGERTPKARLFGKAEPARCG